MLNESAVKDIIYGGLLELAKNPQFYYYSKIGKQYSHFTDTGFEVLKEYTEHMMYLIRIAEEESLNKRAKEIVINGLKGENI
jgi:hypothetical protein